jgi:hypothetical protein
MNAAKLLRMCARRQDPYLALKIMQRYKLQPEEANKYFLEGYRDLIRKEEEEWEAICVALLAD